MQFEHILKQVKAALDGYAAEKGPFRKVLFNHNSAIMRDLCNWHKEVSLGKDEENKKQALFVLLAKHYLKPAISLSDWIVQLLLPQVFSHKEIWRYLDQNKFKSIKTLFLKTYYPCSASLGNSARVVDEIAKVAKGIETKIKLLKNKKSDSLECIKSMADLGVYSFKFTVLPSGWVDIIIQMAIQDERQAIQEQARTVLIEFMSLLYCVPEDIINEITKAISSKELQVQLAALKLLCELEPYLDLDAIPTHLVNAMITAIDSKDLQVQQEALNAFVKLAQAVDYKAKAKIIQAVINLIKNKEPKTQRAGLNLLCKLQALNFHRSLVRGEGFDSITQAYEDGDLEIKVASLRTLAVLSREIDFDESAVTEVILSGITTYSNQAVQKAAFELLNRVVSPEAALSDSFVETLIQKMQESHRYNSSQIKVFLAVLGKLKPLFSDKHIQGIISLYKKRMKSEDQSIQLAEYSALFDEFVSDWTFSFLFIELKLASRFPACKALFDSELQLIDKNKSILKNVTDMLDEPSIENELVTLKALKALCELALYSTIKTIEKGSIERAIDSTASILNLGEETSPQNKQTALKVLITLLPLATNTMLKFTIEHIADGAVNAINDKNVDLKTKQTALMVLAKLAEGVIGNTLIKNYHDDIKISIKENFQKIALGAVRKMREESPTKHLKVLQRASLKLLGVLKPDRLLEDKEKEAMVHAVIFAKKGEQSAEIKTDLNLLLEFTEQKAIFSKLIPAVKENPSPYLLACLEAFYEQLCEAYASIEANNWTKNQVLRVVMRVINDKQNSEDVFQAAVAVLSGFYSRREFSNDREAIIKAVTNRLNFGSQDEKTREAGRKTLAKLAPVLHTQFITAIYTGLKAIVKNQEKLPDERDAAYKAICKLIPYLSFRQLFGSLASEKFPNCKALESLLLITNFKTKRIINIIDDGSKSEDPEVKKTALNARNEIKPHLASNAKNLPKCIQTKLPSRELSGKEEISVGLRKITP